MLVTTSTTRAAAAALLLVASTTNIAAHVESEPTKFTTKHRAAFFQAMQASTFSSNLEYADHSHNPHRNLNKIEKLMEKVNKLGGDDVESFEEALRGDSERSRKLRKKVMERGIYVPPEDVNKSYEEKVANARRAKQQQQQQDKSKSNEVGSEKTTARDLRDSPKKKDANNVATSENSKMEGGASKTIARELRGENNGQMEAADQANEDVDVEARELGDNSNNNNNANNNNNNNNKNNNNSNQVNGKYISYKNYGANGDGTDDYYAGTYSNEFGFDVASYSLSYMRCAEVRQFDTEIAATEDTDSVFATRHFAVVRLCPAKTCMGIFEEFDPEDEDAMYQYEQQSQQYQAEYKQYYNEQLQRKSNYYRKKANDAYARAYGKDAYYSYKADMYDAELQEQQEQDENPDFLLGAQGEGCQSNYGEYLLELQDYLELMAQYREDRFDVYCDYCQGCMYAVYKKWLSKQGRKLASELQEFGHPYDIQDEERWMEVADKALEEERIARILANNNNNNGNNNNANNANYNNYNNKNSFQSYYNNADNQCTYDNQNDYMCQACPEYDTCRYYNKLCNQGIDDDYSQYFECTQVQRNNGMVAYIGPHCADDGETVTLGLFADQYCYEFIGRGSDIRNYLGETLEEDALEDYYNPQDQICIPCRAGDQLYSSKGNHYHDDGNYEDEVNELCTYVYESSARCDKHFRYYSTDSKKNKYYNHEKMMDLACDFIESVAMGEFDENGFVRMESSQINDTLKRNFLQDNIVYEEYGHYVNEVTPVQVFGLCASMMACAILGLWSCALHNSITKNAGFRWRPRRGIQGAGSMSPVGGAGGVQRTDSGIMMGRSMSNVSYYASS